MFVCLFVSLESILFMGRVTNPDTQEIKGRDLDSLWMKTQPQNKRWFLENSWLAKYHHLDNICSISYIFSVLNCACVNRYLSWWISKVRYAFVSVLFVCFRKSMCV